MQISFYLINQEKESFYVFVFLKISPLYPGYARQNLSFLSAQLANL
jgi:hypothetical protein